MTRQEIEPEKLSDATVVVLDVFLATTTLLTILENGARSVLPVASLAEAEEVGEALGAKRLRVGPVGPVAREMWGARVHIPMVGGIAAARIRADYVGGRGKYG